jgi:hypothetical protein
MDCWKIAGVQKLEDEKRAMWICYVCLPDRKILGKTKKNIHGVMIISHLNR